MRAAVTDRDHRGIRALVLLTAVVLALAFAAPAFASSSPLASPSASQAAAPASLTAELSRASVVFGGQVTVSGVLTPAEAGREITVTVGTALVGTATTDAAGAYTLAFTPQGSGEVVAVANLTSDLTVASAPQALAVEPRATVAHGKLVPFLTSTFVVKITPSSYDGLVVVKVVHRGVPAGTYRARAKDGKAVLRFPLRGVDAFTLNVVLRAAAGLDARTLQTKVSVRPKTLSAGSRGPYVKGMLIALQRLAFRVPGIGYSFTTRVKDSVMAFQKAYRLSRTYVFNSACWRKIDRARRIKPRRSSPSLHLEVDKGRQILMVVKGGKAVGIICVSTGATGNTPEGTFRIQQKHPTTASGYGVLVRTMGFFRNFAIHGYAPVPPYPASHGCVREPIWACYWVYDHSFVGETVYIYH